MGHILLSHGALGSRDGAGTGKHPLWFSRSCPAMWPVAFQVHSPLMMLFSCQLQQTSSCSSHMSVIAIFVKSGFPFTVLGVLCAIYFGKQDALELAFVVMW